MAKLSAAQRKALPKSSFALPTQRAYPVNDANHARLALSAASRAEHVGNITAAQKATIVSKAKAKLKGDPMKKEMPMKKLSQDSGTTKTPEVPMMAHQNQTGFKSQKMMDKAAMGGAHKIGKGFDNHEKVCG